MQLEPQLSRTRTHRAHHPIGPGADGDAGVFPAPALDPDLAPALRAFMEFLPGDAGPMTAASLPAVRDMAASAAPSVDLLCEERQFSVREISVEGLEGGPDVPLLVFLPTFLDAPTACLYWVHGGGMVFGNYRDGLPEVLDHARAIGAAVVSVDYRLAPETPHPGPVNDCYAGLVWAASQLGSWAVPSDCLILVGASAGGGLAAATALMARDLGGPHVRGQMLLAPMLDHRNNTVSMGQIGKNAIWTQEANDFGWKSLIGSPHPATVSPLASPALAETLAGLPTSYIDVGGADGFRDEDAAYALRLGQAGVLVEFHIWPGAYHGFEGMAPEAPVSQAAISARTAWFRRLLGQ